MAEIADIFFESVGIIRQEQATVNKKSPEFRGLQVENQGIILGVFGGDEYLDH